MARWLVIGSGALCLELMGCALPSIHRERAKEQDASLITDAQKDAAVSDGGSGDADSDAGVYDPLRDPANRGEDFETFMKLVPKAHVFAEWPMPDTAPNARARPSYSVTDQVVTDNVTKLRWQRVLPEIYSSCTGNYIYVGRQRGVGTGCTWSEAEAFCKSPQLRAQLGEGEWRLPTKIELESLIDPSRVNAVDPLFDGFPIDTVWSSSPVPNFAPNGLKLAWSVDFSEGTSIDSARFRAGRVRCVASPARTGGTASDHEVSSHKVRDRRSQLEWQRVSDSATRTWKEALEYCAQLPLEGGGWRVPTLKELLTIVDPTRRDPAIDVHTFPIAQKERYWTSSEFQDAEASAYQVSFVDGATWVDGSFTDEHYVRCVR